ncbi:hypothetical protein L1987_16570 [Smallanthus sonchifolius]|uniref:Uncharacterized protein n=1 Tax=Smallanthus sonchifolius TaxID=185202 RepID=A0ACB9IV19_9ASTR|nr:hypothetical protein L1987_16570 [Smallanthus sonchifolius]
MCCLILHASFYTHKPIFIIHLHLHSFLYLINPSPAQRQHGRRRHRFMRLRSPICARGLPNFYSGSL